MYNQMLAMLPFDGQDRTLETNFCGLRNAFPLRLNFLYMAIIAVETRE